VAAPLGHGVPKRISAALKSAPKSATNSKSAALGAPVKPSAKKHGNDTKAGVDDWESF